MSSNWNTIFDYKSFYIYLEIFNNNNFIDEMTVLKGNSNNFKAPVYFNCIFSEHHCEINVYCRISSIPMIQSLNQIRHILQIGMTLQFHACYFTCCSPIPKMERIFRLTLHNKFLDLAISSSWDCIYATRNETRLRTTSQT